MGSLPNLNELCEEKTQQRRDAKERDAARERARQLEFIHNRTAKDQLPTLFQSQIPAHQHQQHRHSLTSRKVHRTRSSGATHHIFDDPMMEHMANYSPISSRTHRLNTAPGAFFISTTANPAISASTAFGNVASTSAHANAFTSRRRESMNSSIGATSIRRLLTVNRGCRHKIPMHIRAKVAKNFTFLIVAHGLMCAVLIPLFGLQASNSMWFRQESWLLKRIGPNVGPYLLSFCCLVASGACLFTTWLVKKFGYKYLLIAHYSILCAFLLTHLYPSIWLLLPAYAILGITLGPAWVCKWSLVVFFASRISCGQHDCSTTVESGGSGEENKMVFCNRNERVRRLARWFHAIQDIGIFVGALAASIIISCAATESKCIFTQHLFKFSRDNSISNSSSGSSSSSGGNTNNLFSTTDIEKIPLNTLNDTHRGIDISHLSRVNFSNKSKALDGSVPPPSSPSLPLTKPPSGTIAAIDGDYNNESTGYGLGILKFYQESIFSQHDELLDSLFNTNEHGVRICGSGSCPTWNYASFATNSTEEFSWFFTFSGTIPMTVFYLALALVALILACLSQHVDNTFKCENLKGITDTLLLASPMACFIGTEQAYVLGGFTRAFVSCSLGAQMVAGALVGMGLMQFIVSCTLSMLLRHTKRYAVLAAAFFFQACLLLVLASMKPSQDDSALFYVIAAAWGACNGIWETLLFALITLTHINHIVQISAPLLAFRFLGMGITFAAHGFLCENPKILILFIMLVISVVPYTMLEVRLEQQRKTHSASI